MFDDSTEGTDPTITRVTTLALHTRQIEGTVGVTKTTYLLWNWTLVILIQCWTNPGLDIWSPWKVYKRHRLDIVGKCT